VIVLAEAMSDVCKQLDHLALSSSDREKIHTKAAAGLDPKFSIPQTYNGEEQLEPALLVYSVYFARAVPEEVRHD